MSFSLSSCSNDDNPAEDPALPSTYDSLKPIGFGENTTGGNGQNIILVTTADQLAAAVSGTDPATVYVQGHISIDKMLSVGSNKTILGLSGATISNLNRNENAGIFLLNGSRNVIIRNLTLCGPGAYDIDANYSDNISLVGAKNVWVDHCDIQDGIDGNFDIVEGSDSICVSWTRFHYLIEPLEGGSGGSSDHRNCNLIGNSNNTADLDEGHLNCTFICCWWGEGCVERCPRVRFGKVHVVNCLYDGNDYNYCIGYGVYSNIYVEKCAFTSEKAKQNALKDWRGDKDFNIKVVDCLGIDDVELSHRFQYGGICSEGSSQRCWRHYLKPFYHVKKRVVKCLQLPSHHLAAPFVRFKLIGLTLLIDKYVTAKIKQIPASCNRGLDVDTFLYAQVTDYQLIIFHSHQLLTQD